MDSTGAPPQIAGKKKTVKKHAKAKAVQKRLAPLPTSKSRKQARKITTLFHRYTHLKETVTTVDEKNRIDLLIEGIGGKTAYQKASQVSTSYHSTSKWVLGCLAQNGWLYGIVYDNTLAHATRSSTKESHESLRRRRTERRDTRLLEIGAINTELLDAAAATISFSQSEKKLTENNCERSTGIVPKKYRLHVRAIDLHSMNDKIEEADFLSIPLLHTNNIEEKYDVIVCSMVLNCVPTTVQRGAMLLRIVHFLRPGGLVYITIPKTCLSLSPYMDVNRFKQLLRYVGLVVMEHTKDTPKVAFFVGRKMLKSPAGSNVNNVEKTTEWRETQKIREGRKFRNGFAIILPDDIR